MLLLRHTSSPSFSLSPFPPPTFFLLLLFLPSPSRQTRPAECHSASNLVCVQPPPSLLSNKEPKLVCLNFSSSSRQQRTRYHTLLLLLLINDTPRSVC